MPLVIAIEPDSKQAGLIRRIVRERVGAEVVLAESKDAALAVLRQRMPDLILVSALLSPRDEADLTDHLRELDEAGHLQTLTIPLLASGPRAIPTEEKKSGLFGRFKRRPASALPEGCEPVVFAEQIRGYLDKAHEVRTESAVRRGRKRREAEAATHVETEPLEAERLEAEAAEVQRLELERLQAERLEIERLETERREAGRREAERLEAQRLDAEREAARRKAARVEAERLEAVRRETERVEAARREAEETKKESVAESPARRARKRARGPEAPRPLEDEWGLYDPAQCGFDALFAKIAKISRRPVRRRDRTASQLNDRSEPRSDASARAVPPKRMGLGPLAMWAHVEPPGPSTANTPSFAPTEDALQVLIGQLRLPAGVAAMTYGGGCRIRRVRVVHHERPNRKAPADEPVVIVSRKRLQELRLAETRS